MNKIKNDVECDMHFETTKKTNDIERSQEEGGKTLFVTRVRLVNSVGGEKRTVHIVAGINKDIELKLYNIGWIGNNNSR